LTEISITVTVPEIVLESGVVRHAIMQKMQHKTAPDLQRMFKGTVEGWKDQPNFLQKFKDAPAYLSTTVWPSRSNKAGRTWALVNAGSPPHPITPKRARLLRFQVGYRAGTHPRVLRSRAYSRFGNYVSSLGVQHPGFEAREFTRTIAEEYTETFVKDMQEAVRVASVRRP